MPEASTNSAIFYGLLMFFIILGVLMPFVTSAYSGYYFTNDWENFIAENIEDVAGSNVVSVGAVLWSIVKIVTFTFGQIPIYIDIFIMMPLRFMFIYTLWDVVL